MQLYSRTLVLFYFAISIILLAIGTLTELVKKYYPVVRESLVSFAKERYRSITKSPNRGQLAI